MGTRCFTHLQVIQVRCWSQPTKWSKLTRIRCVQAPLFSNNCRWGEKYIDYKLSLLIYGFLRFLSWPNFAKHHMTTQVSILPVSYWMRASTLRTDKVSEQRPTQNWIECFVAEFFLQNHKSWGVWDHWLCGVQSLGEPCSMQHEKGFDE